MSYLSARKLQQRKHECVISSVDVKIAERILEIFLLHVAKQSCLKGFQTTKLLPFIPIFILFLSGLFVVHRESRLNLSLIGVEFYEIGVDKVGIFLSVGGVEQFEGLSSQQLIILLNNCSHLFALTLVFNCRIDTLQEGLLFKVPQQHGFILFVFLLDETLDVLNFLFRVTVSHVNNYEIAVLLVVDGVKHILLREFLHQLVVIVDQHADGDLFGVAVNSVFLFQHFLLFPQLGIHQLFVLQSHILHVVSRVSEVFERGEFGLSLEQGIAIFVQLNLSLQFLNCLLLAFMGLQIAISIH